MMANQSTQKNLGDLMKNMLRCKIVNNIVEGPFIPYQNTHKGLGAFVLEKLKKDENFVGQLEATSGKEDTFGEMRDRSIRCAIWMRKNGIQPEDVIAICTNNHLDTVTPCFASLYIGAVFNPLEPSMNARDVEHVIKITRPKIAFVSEDSVETVISAAKQANLRLKIVVFGNVSGYATFPQILAEQTATEVEDFRSIEIVNVEQCTAMILCSSGTSGLPKGVALSHAAILKQQREYGNSDTENRSMIVVTPLYWLSGTLLMFSTLNTRIRRIIPPTFEEDLACRLIEKYKVKMGFFSSSATNRLINSGAFQKYDLSCLKIFMFGGGCITKQSLKMLKEYLPNITVSQGYGMTEAGGAISVQMPDSQDCELESCGHVVSNARLKIIDPDTGKLLGINQEGAICVQTSTMMMHYYGNPQATAEIFDADGWLHTGDLGFYNEHGEVFVIDRLKDLIKYRGHQVSTLEIEKVLLDHPGVHEAAVVAVRNETDDEHPMAFVVKMPESKVTEQELMDLVAAELADSKKLRGGVRFLTEMPMTPSRKIKKVELKKLAMQNSIAKKL